MGKLKRHKYTPREPSNNVELSIVNCSTKYKNRKVVKIYSRKGKRKTWTRVKSIMKCNVSKIYFFDSGKEVSLKLER